MPALWELGHGTTALQHNTHWQSIEARGPVKSGGYDVMASAVMALWSVSMPLNQAASMRRPTINEPFCSAWPLGRIAPSTWRLYFCRSLPALLSINTTNGVVFHSEMDICPLTLVSVYLVYCWTYFRKCYMAFNPQGKMDCLDKLSHPLRSISQESWLCLFSPQMCLTCRWVTAVCRRMKILPQRTASIQS